VNRYLVLVCILVTHTVLWLGLKPATPHSDDLNYVEEGDRIFSSDYTLSESPKSQRFTVIIPVKTFRLLLGSSPYATSLWPLLCSLLTIAAVFLLLWPANPQVAGSASLLLTFNIEQIIYASVAFPDVVVSLFACMAAALLSLRNDNNQWLPFWIVLILLTGFFAKQIILFILPFFVYTLINDYRNSNYKKFGVRFSLYSIGAAGILLAGSKWLTHDFLFLLHSVEKNHNDVFVNLSASELFYRLSIEPVIYLFQQLGYWPLILYAAPAFLIKDEKLLFWKQYLVFLVLMLWLFTTSFRYWAPLPLLSRMWMMTLLPLVILSAYSLHSFLKDNRNKTGLLIFLFLCLISVAVSLYFISPVRAWLFFSYLCGVLAGKWVYNYKKDYLVASGLQWLPYVLTGIWFVIQNSNWK